MAVAGLGVATGSAVQVEDVVKSYGGASTAVVALRGVSIAVRAGERVALLGKSGSDEIGIMKALGRGTVISAGSSWWKG